MPRPQLLPSKRIGLAQYTRYHVDVQELQVKASFFLNTEPAMFSQI